MSRLKTTCSVALLVFNVALAGQSGSPSKKAHIASSTDSADDVRRAVEAVAEIEPTEEEIGASGTEETHEPAQESPAEEHAREQPKRKTGFQRRLDKLTRENYELLERIRQLETAKPTNENTSTPRKVESLQELASWLDRADLTASPAAPASVLPVAVGLCFPPGLRVSSHLQEQPRRYPLRLWHSLVLLRLGRRQFSIARVARSRTFHRRAGGLPDFS